MPSATVIRRFAPLLAVALVAILALLPAIGLEMYWMRQIILICLMALAVSSLSLTVGYAGELSLGQAAIYAAGAYTTGYVAKYVLNDLLFALFCSIVVGLLIGLLIGVPGLRMAGWVLAIMSFFMVILIPSIINLLGDKFGGYSGLTGIPRAEVFGVLLDDVGFYVAVIIVTSVWFVLFRNIVKSRHGVALLVLKESPILASSLGMAPYSMKLQAYAIASVPPAMAGCLFAYMDGFIAPESFGMHLAVTLLAAAILGGMVSVTGALIGSAVLVLGPAQSSFFAEYAMVSYGVLLLVGGVLFNDGLVGLSKKLWKRYSPSRSVHDSSPAANDVDTDLGQLAGPTLLLENVCKNFGGLAAVRDVRLTAQPGEITALIGPNGSGKTTTLNLISGYYVPDSGAIRLGDTSLAGMKVHNVSRAGVGRTFQTPIMPKELTVREVVMAANFANHRSSFLDSALRLPRFYSSRLSDEKAESLLTAVGLSHIAHLPAASLALGTRRMVELVRAVAGGNHLILLDEVAAGLDEAELAELAKVVTALKRAGATIVLVEHNFAFVQAIADKVYVLAEGMVLSSGTVEEIKADQNVLRSYLGEGSGITGTRIRATIEKGTA